MVRKFIFACTLVTVLSAGAVSFKQISSTPKLFPGCSSSTCTKANPNVCGVCFCNLPQGFCTRDPIGAK